MSTANWISEKKFESNIGKPIPVQNALSTSIILFTSDERGLVKQKFHTL